MNHDRTEFRRHAVQPMVCLTEGWRLIKPNYWLFVGICFVGMLIASVGPMGILMGPMMCGIHLCLMRAERGLSIDFGMLFKGFDYFLPGVVAALLMMVPMVIMIVSTYVLFFGGMFAGIAALGPRQGGGPPGDAFFFYMISLFAVMYVAIMVFSTVLQAIFLFVFPLIVDRELSGWDAVVLSFRAFLGNFFGVMAFVILLLFLNLLSVLACYVGLIFFLPLGMAMTEVAYRQVFPELESSVDGLRDFDDDDDLPPPPKWSLPSSTDITTGPR